MQDGDIVQVTKDWKRLTVGTRLRIISANESCKNMFTVIEKTGAIHHNVPGEVLEWIA